MSNLSDIATHTRASSATYVDADGVLQTAAINVPRVGHHLWNGSAWVDAGYFHESEARTNLIVYSEDFTDLSWDKTNTATLALDATGPFGVANSAVTLVDAGTSATDNAVRINSAAFTVTTSTAYTFSMFCKADQLDWVHIRTHSFTSPANTGVYFDLATGVLGTEGAGVAGLIEDYGSGWYRCSITFTTDVADTSGSIRVFLADTDNDTTVALDGTSSILIYGAQFEAGSTPSSYIPTAGSTVTRAADVMTIPAANLPWPEPEVIGPELVTNGDFSSGTASWVDQGTPTAFTVSDGIASITADNQSGIKQGLGSLDDGLYLVEFDLLSATSNLQALFDISGSSGTSGPVSSTTGKYSFIASKSGGTVGTLTIKSRTAANTFTIDNISVREINPLAVSIQMSGTMTYADEGIGAQVIYNLWQKDGNNFIRQSLLTLDGTTGNPHFIQRALGLNDALLAGSTYSPGVNVPFNIASRHGSTFLNGAVDGTALTADLTPTALPDLENTDMQIATAFNGTIDLFRVWKVDITDAGIAEASA